MSISYRTAILGACAALLSAGCAQVGPQAGAPAGLQQARIEPVYRVDQPVGTAAGQYAIGRIDLVEGRHEAAIRRFRQALQLDPVFVDAHNGLGVAYGQMGRFAEAADAFRAALASGPVRAHVVNNLGFAQLKAGQFDEAWQSLRRAYELDPHNAKTRENLALLAEARRVAAARVVPERAAPERAAAPMPVAALPAAPVAPEVQAAPAVAAAEPVSVGSEASVVEEAAAAAAGEQVAGEQAPAVVQLAETPQPASPAAVAAGPVPVAALTVVAQASAARLLGEQPNRSAYEIVLSRAGESELVQVGSGVYELRDGAGAMAAAAAAAPVAPLALAPVPAIAAAPALPLVSAARVAPAPMPAESTQAAVRPVRGYRVAAREATHPDVPALRPATLTSWPVVSPRSSPAKVAVGQAAPVSPRLALKSVAGLEVSNGVGLRTLAARTARQLERFGAKVVRVSDFRVYGKAQSEIHYLPGHLAGARTVGQRLPVTARMVEVARMQPGVNVRLVVGRDMVVGPMAWWSPNVTEADSVTLAAKQRPVASAIVAEAPTVPAPEAVVPLSLADVPGVDLQALSAKLARLDVEDGWRHL